MFFISLVRNLMQSYTDSNGQCRLLIESRFLTSMLYMCIKILSQALISLSEHFSSVVGVASWFGLSVTLEVGPERLRPWFYCLLLNGQHTYSTWCRNALNGFLMVAAKSWFLCVRHCAKTLHLLSWILKAVRGRAITIHIVNKVGSEYDGPRLSASKYRVLSTRTQVFLS